ncbi:flavin-nucleotide-binding protein [Cucurbitaria berberidis CBS 394.84]|uniref:Flavin-nucleotide-binding protein n=1 Tax=Cucurbitaria berberidis CBS 394.84 TaxID=1168544 RepID=A0A9P4GP08_9PLEO|nr:flavin-nucleotide-binding protein [Cucurbitaria berberidis CBS 394.84]KAF1848954.1 flavin-nucleotide-binding protein [Cucurbitaria berberidis CBS 394.84]
MAEQSTYPQTGENKVNRYKHQATYDVDTIHGIVNTTPVLHVSFVPDPSIPAPIVLPMIGQIGLYPNDSTWNCYLHGYVSSRLMNLASAAISRGEPGLPLCVAATKVDGFVLSLTPNSHNYNYRSAVMHGFASIVEDVDEKIWAMRLITNSVVPERYENTRVPPDGAEMQSTRILKMRITGASGKVREGVPEDERKDLKRDDVLDSVWTGVIPVYEKLGEPVPGPYNRVKKVPDHVVRFVKEENAIRETYASDAARKPAPLKRVKRTEE